MNAYLNTDNTKMVTISVVCGLLAACGGGGSGTPGTEASAGQGAQVFTTEVQASSTSVTDTDAGRKKPHPRTATDTTTTSPTTDTTTTTTDTTTTTTDTTTTTTDTTTTTTDTTTTPTTSTTDTPTETTSSSTTTTVSYSPATNYDNAFCSTNNYPAQWTWDPNIVKPKALPATSGTPRITQIRDGKVIAVYSNFGGDAGYSKMNATDGSDTSVGPFRRRPYQQWQNGDVFEVDPAVYSGANMQIYIGPNSPDGSAGSTVVPANITIRGKTVDGRRPVIVNPPTGASYSNYNQSLIYIEGRIDAEGNRTPASNITIENMDVVDSPTGGNLGKAAIYVNGVHNMTLRDVRIAGFRQHSSNGILATNNNSGTLLLERVELDGNGGANGPEHNAYISGSAFDPNFTFKVVNSWSRNSYYGHLLKSRAQRTIVEGSYLMGSRAAPGTQTETYLLDVPDGGILEARNNVFVKNYSGNMSNGAAVTFGVESASTSRAWGLTLEHNTFVGFSKFYDDQSHFLYPMFLRSTFPVAGPRVVDSNVFVGFCPTGNAGRDDRGTNASILNFNEIDMSFRPRTPLLTGKASIVGTPAYAHDTAAARRQTNAVGARD